MRVPHTSTLGSVRLRGHQPVLPHPGDLSCFWTSTCCPAVRSQRDSHTLTSSAGPAGGCVGLRPGVLARRGRSTWRTREQPHVVPAQGPPAPGAPGAGWTCSLNTLAWSACPSHHPALGDEVAGSAGQSTERPVCSELQTHSKPSQCVSLVLHACTYTGEGLAVSVNFGFLLPGTPG